jgi:hypothetical protein
MVGDDAIGAMGSGSASTTNGIQDGLRDETSCQGGRRIDQGKPEVANLNTGLYPPCDCRLALRIDAGHEPRAP